MCKFWVFFIVALNDVLNLLISNYWKLALCIMYTAFCNIKVHSVLTVLYGHLTLFTKNSTGSCTSNCFPHIGLVFVSVQEIEMYDSKWWKPVSIHMFFVSHCSSTSFALLILTLL